MSTKHKTKLDELADFVAQVLFEVGREEAKAIGYEITDDRQMVKARKAAEVFPLTVANDEADLWLSDREKLRLRLDEQFRPRMRKHFEKWAKEQKDARSKLTEIVKSVLWDCAVAVCGDFGLPNAKQNTRLKKIMDDLGEGLVAKMPGAVVLEQFEIPLDVLKADIAVGCKPEIEKFIRAEVARARGWS